MNIIDAVLIPTVSLAFLRPPVVALWNQCAFTIVDTPTFTENVFTPTLYIGNHSFKNGSEYLGYALVAVYPS